MKNGSRATDASVGRVSGEIDMLRNELGALVAELDRRRHEAFDVRLQMSRHPLLVATVATAAALLVGGVMALAMRGRRQRRRPTVRAREAGSALARLLRRPDRVAKEPSVANKIGSAVGVAIATAVAKRIVERSIAPRPGGDRGERRASAP